MAVEIPEDAVLVVEHRQAFTVFSVVGPPTGADNCRSICGPGFTGLPLGEAVEHLLEAFRGQVLVGVVPDQHHRRVHAGAEALDLLPGEIAVRRDVQRIVVDALVADLEQRLGAAQHARRGAADLDVRLLADRREQEHGVEGRDLERADVRHAEHVGDVPDRGLAAASRRAAPARATAAG